MRRALPAVLQPSVLGKPATSCPILAPWRLPAQADEVARSALVLAPRRKTQKAVRAQCLADVQDLVPYRGEKRVVHRLTSSLALLVEVQHLDQVGGLASELLVSDRVNV